MASDDRRSPRERLRNDLAAMLDFATVVSTRMSDTVKNVLATLRGDSGEQGDEEREGALWGHAAIMFRPPAGTEWIVLRRGEELVGVASRETRWQIEIEEGEVVLRNLVSDTASQARIRLKANGECVIDSPKIYIGDAGATEKMALGTAIKGHLDAIRTYLAALSTHATTHTHEVAAAPGTAAFTTMPISGSNPTVPDVESRHVVEN